MKRVTKKGGRILLLERGNAIWMYDKFELMRRASFNLGARGQIYHFNFENMVQKDPEVKVIKEKRKFNGMLYYYVLEKL